MPGAQRRQGRGGRTPGRAVEAAPPSIPETGTPAISQHDGSDDRDTPMPLQVQTLSKNVDVGMTVWGHVNNAPIDVPKRPAPSKLGREISIGLNTFKVTSVPTVPVYQYDVLFGSGEEPKPLVAKLWASKAVKAAIPAAHRWIFDGNKIAWSTEQLPREVRFRVDLDEEEGRAKTAKSKDFGVVLKPSGVVRFDALKAYLEAKADFSTGCLEAINFLDHLLREGPSKRMTTAKRSFYQTGTQQHRVSLGGGAEHLKGVYQSIRFGHSVTGQHGLIVNADVANGAFWSPTDLAQVIGQLLNCGPNQIAKEMSSLKGAGLLKKLRHVRVETNHRGELDTYCVARFKDTNARTEKIPASDGKPAQTVEEYFKSKYNYKLKHPDWPVVLMTRKQTMPLELLKIKENSRMNAKLDAQQTSAMVKHAATPPPQRLADIQNGLRLLDWSKDPYLAGYGLKIDGTQMITKARVLPNPKVTFANGDLDPRTSGRWRIDGKKFLTVNRVPVKSWGVCITANGRNVDRASVERFISSFVKIYRGHGGKIETEKPLIHIASNPDPAKAAEEAYNATGNYFKMKPQILMFVLPNKDATYYGRIKKTCECRYGVVSQCMQAMHVDKAQPQYISNLAMKYNAKLGGSTARAVGPTTKSPTGIFKVPTMIVGADVTHPPPASQAAVDEQRSSVAAITMSMDAVATKYAARANSNGYRVEMIKTENWTKLWKPMIMNWMSSVGGGRFPQHILYFRDGVSEGQFASVINQEVHDMKELLKTANPNHGCKFVVIIAVKRHSVRMFPKPNDASSGDKNGNPLPGTLVDTTATHPFENDFFLCSHVAIKGTARPTRYHVILNEAGLSNEFLQTMIYEHSYQFVRATTPVNLFPAVYYADIAAARATYHDPKFGGQAPVGQAARGRDDVAASPSGSRAQSKARSLTQGTTSSGTPSTVADLLQMPGDTGINETMWYV